ncbi:MAG: hypothetical protein COB38_10260 [Gammaproteobacteria bacterium]|nr:MAG: hypothetical protein COB38_10260 [Gammaproteobacteria bacterium]
MNYFFLILMSIVFVELFLFFKIIADAQSVMALSSKSVKVMQSKKMSDREKEKFMRTNSVIMLSTTFKFIGKFILIFAVLFGILWSIAQYEPTLASQIESDFYSITVIIGLTLATLGYVWIRNVIRRKL